MENISVFGEVWINNQKTNAKLFPYISEFGFGLKNQSRGFSGPHTHIDFSPEKFMEIMAHVDKEGDVVVHFSGERLGSISENSGAVSADVGAHSREIVEYTFRVSRQKSYTKFEFNGETDYLNPLTVRPSLNENLKDLGRYNFSIWFNIFDCDIAAHFKNKIYLEAMVNYIRKCTI